MEQIPARDKETTAGRAIIRITRSLQTAGREETHPEADVVAAVEMAPAMVAAAMAATELELGKADAAAMVPELATAARVATAGNKDSAAMVGMAAQGAATVARGEAGGAAAEVAARAETAVETGAGVRVAMGPESGWEVPGGTARVPVMVAMVAAVV